MKKNVVILFLLLSGVLHAQTDDEQLATQRRKATKQEVKILAHLADSFLTELKILYKLEVQENSPRKYQPERIALVRSYLMVFQAIENSSGVVAYSSADISQIFGKPDTIVKRVTSIQPQAGTVPLQTEWLYGKLQTKYVRINNLRYRFYFKNNVLEAVKRDDK